MLMVHPTRYGAGVTLWGDAHDLAHLRDTIYDLSDEEAVGPALSALLLGLAYDVRHAYQRDRLEQTIGLGDLDATRYRGCQILWPYFLVQVSLLRHAAGYRPTTAGHQADLYRLEAATAAALQEADAQVAQACLELLPHVGDLPHGYLVSFIDVQVRHYLSGPGGKRRLARLPALLRSLQWLGPEYREYERQLKLIAEEKGCQPADLEDAGEWPEFRW